MKNLIYTFSMFVVLSLTAQPIDFTHTTLLSFMENDDESTITVKVSENTDFDNIDEGYLLLDFNSKDYLPENFDPYAGMFYQNVSTLEEKTQFNFDHNNYLPENFDAYQGMFLTETANNEDENSLNFDHTAYLPENFDAYNGMFLEQDGFIQEIVTFDFDHKKYLPLNFNPYTNYHDNEEGVLKLMIISLI
jgi:hypothetical protein